MLKQFGRIILIAFILGLVAIPLISIPAYAVVAQPKSSPTLTLLHANTSLYQTGDMLFYGMYNIPYTTLPADDNANECFKFDFMDSGKTTIYGTASFYIYHDKGYNHGLVAFYFPAGVLTWGTAYNIRIEEIDAKFTSPVDVDVTVPASIYSTETTQADNQAELAEKLYKIGQTLEVEFGTAMFTSSNNGWIFTDAGEKYFQGAISGLIVMAPSLFLFQSLPLDTTTRTYTTEQFDSYETRFQGTWVGTAMTSGGAVIGMGGNMFMMFAFTLPLCLAGIIFTAMKFKHTEPGLIFAALVMILAVLMGWMPTALFATIFQLFGIYIGYLIFYAHSSDVLGHKLLSFSIFCYFVSILICVVLEGTYFGSDERSIFNNLSLFTTYTLPIIGDIPVFDPSFIGSFAKILTWDYSFYTGSYGILRWFWFPLLSAGPAWGLVQIFINLVPSIISIFRPNITV
jgi:hypothetical protein